MYEQGGVVNYSETTMIPTGGVDNRRSIAQPALHENLMGLIVDSDNMQRAWKQVKGNDGAPGIDGMTIDDFPAFAREHWETIRQALLDGTYQPIPLKRVNMPKPGGRGVRMLGIPIVLDRLITQAVSQVLTPIFDPGFSESSFGSRPKRSPHGALRKVQQYIKEGYSIAVDLDQKIQACG